MANQEFTTVFKLAGALDNSFTNGFLKAQNALSALRSSHHSLDNELSSLDGVLSAREQLAKLRQAASVVSNSVIQINQKLSSSSSSRLANSFEQAKERAYRLRAELEKQKQALSSLEQKNGTFGRSTSELVNRQEALNKALEKQRAIQSKLLNLSNAQANAYSKMQNANAMVGNGVANVATAGASLAGIFAMPVQSAIKSEEDMAELRKFSEKYAEIANLNTQLSKTIAISTRDMVSLQTAAMQASILNPNDVKAIELYTTTAAKAMIALDLTGEEVGSSFSEIKNKISGDLQETVKAFDLVNAIANQTSASGKDVLEVLSRTGGSIAALTHLDTTRVVALAGAFRAASNSAEVAATSQAAFINALMAGAGATKGQKEGYKKLGVDAVKLAKAMVQGGQSAEAAIFDIFDRLGKLKDDEKSNIIGQIFGNDAGIKSAVATLSKQRELLNKPFEIASKNSNYSGSMQAEYESRAATTANQLILLKNNSEALASSFGSIFLPAVNAVSKSVIKFLDPVSSWIEGTTANFNEQSKAILGVSTSISELTAKGDISTLDQITGGHRQLVITLAKVVGGLVAFKVALGLSKILLGSILTPLNLLGRAFLFTRKAVLLSSLALRSHQVVTVASKVATMGHIAVQKSFALVSLASSGVVKTLRASMLALGVATQLSTIKTVAFTVAQKSLAVASLATSGLLKTLRGAMLAFNLVMSANPIGLLITAFGSLVLAGTYLYRNFDTIRLKVASLVESFKTSFPNAFNVVNTVFSQVSSVIGFAMQGFSGLINFVKNIFLGNWTDAWAQVKSVFINTFQGLADFLLAPFKQALSLIDSVSNSAGNALNKVKGFITDNSAYQYVSSLFGSEQSEAKVPALAEGGVVSKPTLALIGEGAQSEAVVPLNKLPNLLSSLPSTQQTTNNTNTPQYNISISVSPNISMNAQSSGNVSQDVSQAMQIASRDIEAMVRKVLAEHQRLAY